MRKGGRKCEQGEKAWMLCGWEVKYKNQGGSKMPRTQKEDGSWEAIEFGSGNAECGNWKMKSKGKDMKVRRWEGERLKVKG
jgi:hypothetical protein